MFKTKYIPNSIEIKDVKIQYKKLYKVTFINGKSIKTQIVDEKIFYDDIFGPHIYAGIRTPENMEILYKYSSKLKHNDTEGEKYLSKNIFKYELINSSIQSITVLYDFNRKNWLVEYPDTRSMNFSNAELLKYNLNDLSENAYKTSLKLKNIINKHMIENS